MGRREKSGEGCTGRGAQKLTPHQDRRTECLNAGSPKSEPAPQSDGGPAFWGPPGPLLLCHLLRHPAPAHRAPSANSELRGVGARVSHEPCFQTCELTPCQCKKLPRNGSPIPETFHPHTGPTVHLPRSTYLEYFNRTAQVC